MHTTGSRYVDTGYTSQGLQNIFVKWKPRTMRFQRSTTFLFLSTTLASTGGFSLVTPLSHSHRLKYRSSGLAMSATGTSSPQPNLPLPPPILSDEPGTWAYDTMTRRVDADILQRTYEDIETELHSPGFEDALKNFNSLALSCRTLPIPKFVISRT